MRIIISRLSVLALFVLLSACGVGDYGLMPEDNEYSDAYYEQPVEEEPELPPPVRRGVIEDDVYASDFLGLSFTLPGEDWSFMDDEYIAARLELGGELIAEHGVELDVQDDRVLYDMMALCGASDSMIVVMIEDISQMQGAQRYLQGFKEQLETPGVFEFEFDEDFQVTLGGQQFDVISASVDIGEVRSQQHYLVRRQGDNMVVVIVFLFGDLTLDDIIEHFGDPHPEAEYSEV